MLKKAFWNTAVLPFLVFLMPISAKGAVGNPFPAPTGPYKVGVVWRHWVDQSRDETYDKTPHGKRELMVEFLYPANPQADAKPAQYMANREAILSSFADVLTGVGAQVSLLPADFAQ